MQARKLRALVAVVISVAVFVGVAPSEVPAAEPLRVLISAPERVAAGAPFAIEALVINRNDTDVTFSPETKATGLTLGKTAGGNRIWLARKTVHLLRWEGTAGDAGNASFAIAIDGKDAAAKAFEISPVARPVALASVHVLNAKPLVVAMPEAGRRYDLELEFTAGARGELEVAIAGLREVSGFSLNAIIARSIASRALGLEAAVPELDALAAIQDASGGWGATPMAVPEVHSTSWALFWLGRLSEAGHNVDKKMVDGAVAFLRKNWPGAGSEMRARILTGLASASRLEDDDLRGVSEQDVPRLSRSGALLAAWAGARIPLPPRDDWPKLNALETAALILALVKQGRSPEAAALLPALVMLRGPQPGWASPEALLSALAFKALADHAAPGAAGTASATLDANPAEEMRLGAGTFVVRRRMTAAPPPERKAELRVAGPTDKGVFCRVIARPAE